MSKPDLVSQPTMMPTRKVSAGFLASLLGLFVIQAFKAWAPGFMSPEMQALIPAATDELLTILIGFGTAWCMKERAPAPPVPTNPPPLKRVA